METVLLLLLLLPLGGSVINAVVGRLLPRRVCEIIACAAVLGAMIMASAALALAGSRTPFVYRSIGDPMAWSGSGLRRVRTAALLRRAARVVPPGPGTRPGPRG